MSPNWGGRAANAWSDCGPQPPHRWVRSRHARWL